MYIRNQNKKNLTYTTSKLKNKSGSWMFSFQARIWISDTLSFEISLRDLVYGLFVQFYAVFLSRKKFTIKIPGAPVFQMFT